MQRFQTHLCLVSAQATPNLLPVLDQQWRPEQVVLATSQAMRREADALARVLRGKGQGLRVDLLELPDPYDYAALSDAFMSYLAANEGRQVALNVTGGTKLMAVAAQEAFRADNRPVFYVNVENDEAIVIGDKQRSQALSAPLKVRELLEAHGYTVETQQRQPLDREQREVCARLVDHVRSGGQALGQLNLLAAQARQLPHLKVELTDAQFDSRKLNDIVDLFEEGGQLQRLAGQQLQFTSEASRQFVNGGWLEWHVYNTIKDLQGAQPKRLSDVAMNIKVVHPDGRTRNEVDVAFLFRNTLHLIECKTANLAVAGAAGDEKATEALYKMESLLKLGGLRTRGMIVDYRGALSSHGANLDRARSMGIEVVGGAQIQDLKGRIGRTWLRTP